MGNKQIKISAGNCPSNRINVSFEESFSIQPSIIVTPIVKYGDMFIVKISEVDRYGFRFTCLKLDGTPMTNHEDFFQWIAIGK